MLDTATASQSPAATPAKEVITDIVKALQGVNYRNLSPQGNNWYLETYVEDTKKALTQCGFEVLSCEIVSTKSILWGILFKRSPKGATPVKPFTGPALPTARYRTRQERHDGFDPSLATETQWRYIIDLFKQVYGNKAKRNQERMLLARFGTDNPARLSKSEAAQVIKGLTRLAGERMDTWYAMTNAALAKYGDQYMKVIESILPTDCARVADCDLDQLKVMRVAIETDQVTPTDRSAAPTRVRSNSLSVGDVIRLENNASMPDLTVVKMFQTGKWITFTCTYDGGEYVFTNAQIGYVLLMPKATPSTTTPESAA